MEEMKKNIRRIFWLFFSLFIMLVLFLGKFVLLDASELMSHPYNPRLRIIDQSFARGDILDKDNNVLATSVLNANESAYMRKYPYGEVTATVTGFTEKGGLGIELTYGTTLQNLHMEIIQRMTQIAVDKPLKGNSLKLTVDIGLQEICYEALENRVGSIVALEPSTGKVLSMVSTPTFDPQSISIDWNDITANSDSPLVNRSLFGLYPPGSVFKIVTTLSMMRNMDNWDTFTYTCSGTEVFGDKTLQCYDQTAHGEQTVFDAFTVSCNTFFARASVEMGSNRLRATADSLYFNKDIPFSLGVDDSVFTIGSTNSKDDASTSISELVETSIGQGQTLVTPMHLALITSAIGNGGVMMKPYIVDNILDKNGKVINSYMPAMIENIMTSQESIILNDMMTQVVETGTGKQIAIADIPIAAKTGTAQTNSGDDHGLIVALAPSDNPIIALAVVYENAGGSKATLTDVKNILEYYLNK